MHEDALIAALSDPSAYAHPVERVVVHRTHISLVFVAGARVYKVKRAIDAGFLDCTTLERRRFFCGEEVRLNRRLAPETYFGVVPIVGGGAGALRVGAAGAPIEYAVEMTRLDPSGMLDRLVAERRVDAALLEPLLETIAAFHRSAARGPEIDAFAAPRALRERITTNLDRLAAHPSIAGDAAALVQGLVRRTGAWIDRSTGLLTQRVADGRVCEGHGDLHAGNVCLDRGRWVVFDCVEFSRPFRCVDVAAEIAFLAMDLDVRGSAAGAAPGLGAWLLDACAGRTGDPLLPAVAPLYRSHYAAVRAMALAMRAGGEPDPLGPRYLHAAAAALLPPAVIVLCGLPGSGKSRAAEAIASALGAVAVRSDLVRKELAGIGPADRSQARPGASMYAPAFTARVRDEVARRAAAALESGRPVVIDASAARRDWRDAMAAVAAGAAAPRLVVWLDPPDAVIRERLARRAAEPDEPSDAGIAAYESMAAAFEPPREVEPRALLRVADGRGAAAIATAALAALLDAGAPA